jgi:hypothetical protein
MAKRDHLRDTPDPRRGDGRNGLTAALDRRGVAFACGAALFFICLCVYAGGAWGLVLYELATNGPILAAWLVCSLGVGAALLRLFRLRPDDHVPGLLPIVTSSGLGLGVLSILVLALGLAGLLSRFTAIALLAAGVALAVIEAVRYGRGRRPGEADAAVRAWSGAPAGWAWLWLAVVPLLAIAAVGAIVPPGFLWTPDEPHGYDVVEYHLQVPREWYEAGRIVPLGHNVFSYFPFNVEAHYLLAMQVCGGPWNGMYLAQLMHASYVVLSVLAVYAFARTLTPSASGAVFAGVGAASVPWLTLLAPIAYNEGGLLLYGTLAIGWTLRAGRAATGGSAGGMRGRTLALAGTMAGFACGAKLTAAPTVLAAVPVALAVQALIHRPARWSGVVTGAVTFVLFGVIVFGPWLARNVAWARNPVFPEAMSLLGRAHFSEVQVQRWERAHKPPPAQSPKAARLKAFGSEVLFNWQFGYVLLPLGIVAAVVARRNRNTILLATLLLVFAGFWLAVTHLQGRFFVLAIPVAALLVAAIDWGRWSWVGATAVAVAAGVGLVTMHLRFSSRMDGAQGLTGVIAVPGVAFEQLHPPELQSLPPDATLTLVGEARAFWFSRKMKWLRYRTVFDVDTDPATDLIDSWRGQAVPNEWLFIEPAELTRFSRTYFGVPQPPQEVRVRTEPYVVPPTGNPAGPVAAPPR